MRRGDETGTTRANAGLHRYAVTCAARRGSRTGPAIVQCSEAAGRFARDMLRPEDEMRWKSDEVASVAIASRVITPCFPTMREIGEHHHQQQQQQQQQTGAQLMSDSGFVRRVVLWPIAAETRRRTSPSGELAAPASPTAANRRLQMMLRPRLLTEGCIHGGPEDPDDRQRNSKHTASRPEK